jgi:hypothetical protein
LTAGFLSVAETIHVEFPVPGHPDYPQDVRARTFPLLQKEKRAFTYSYRARAEGMDPAVPPGNSNFGMNMCVRYMDGSVKWFDPGRESADGFRLSGEGVRPLSAVEGWQELSGVFVPPRAVSNVTMYCRIARPGKAWFDSLKIREHEPAAVRGPCTFKERKGYIQLANDFIRLIVDPAHGGTVVRLTTLSDGVEHARGRKCGLFADVFEGHAADTSRVYEVVRRRDTPSSAEVTMRLTGPAGHPFLEIEKTVRIVRDRPGVEVVRRYRNLPAAMSDVEIVPTEDGRSERLTVPLGGTVTRRKVFFAPESGNEAREETVQGNSRFRLELSEELTTPHTPWLKPYAGGRTRALFILDIRQQREIVELAQRMDLEARSVRIAQVLEYMSWGMIDRYGAYNFSDMNRDLAVELADGRYDVVVIAGRLWERIDEANRSAIMKMLESGTGLVAIENGSLIPGGYAENPDGAAYVKNGIPGELLPFGADRIRSFSKGASRAVLLGYKAFDGLTPFVYYDWKEPGFFYADYTLGMVAKSLLWAAKKDMPVPKGAAVEESHEDSGDGLLIRRRIYRGPKGSYGFDCEITHGESSAAAKARLAGRDRSLDFPSAPPQWPDFPFSVGECCHRNGIKRYLLPLRYSQLKSLGVNQIRFWAVDGPDQYRPYFKYGLGFDFPVGDGGQIRWNRFQKEFSEPYAKTKDRRYLVRNPCLNDPAFLAKDKAAVAATVERLSCLHPVSYDCGDENSLSRWSAPFDFCFGECCLKAFRIWLETQYGTLSNLNGCWGTAFARWEDVKPDLTSEARERAAKTGRKAYGAWADHRRFMELTYANYFAELKKTVLEKAPGARFDMSGTQPPNGWTGMDMWLIGGVIDLPALYDVENLGEIIRSFRRPFAHPWFGYRLDGARGRWRAWNDAFRYLDFGISFYHEGLMLMPDYTVPGPVAELADALSDLRAGGARLLRSLEGEEEVLVHYSQASVHAAQIEERYDDFLGVRDSWCRRLVACGKQFRFVAYAEIEDGILDRTEAKTVILPHSAALSAKEAAALRRFASRGGRIVGDAHSGRMDEHCRELEKNPIADIVSRDDGFGKASTDGVREFRFRSRKGLPGRYYGFTRDVDAKGGKARRTVRLGRPGFVYDLRRKLALGLKDSFEFEIAPGDAAFFAVLPYEAGAFAAKGPAEVAIGAEAVFSLKLAVSSGKSGFHPVKVEVFGEDGLKIDAESGMSQIEKSAGEWSFRVGRGAAPGVRRVVFTDFITGRTSACTVKVVKRR